MLRDPLQPLLSRGGSGPVEGPARSRVGSAIPPSRSRAGVGTGYPPNPGRALASRLRGAEGGKEGGYLLDPGGPVITPRGVWV